MNKKADFDNFWIEYVAGALLLLIFYIAARSAYVGMAYVVAGIIGLVLGKFWYTAYKKNKSKVYITILTLAIFLGVILGSFGTDRRFIVILFLMGICISYIAHAERWIKTI